MRPASALQFLLGFFITASSSFFCGGLSFWSSFSSKELIITRTVWARYTLHGQRPLAESWRRSLLSWKRTWLVSDISIATLLTDPTIHISIGVSRSHFASSRCANNGEKRTGSTLPSPRVHVVHLQALQRVADVALQEKRASMCN